MMFYQRVYGTISHFIPMKSHVSVLQLPCPWHLQDLELRSLLRSGGVMRHSDQAPKRHKPSAMGWKC